MAATTKLVQVYAPCLCDPQQEHLRVRALQWELLGLLATVYPCARRQNDANQSFSAPHANLSLSFHPCFFYFYFFTLQIIYTRDSFFYLHHHLCVMAAASNATNATWIFVVCGLALETWQDIGNAHGCLTSALIGSWQQICFFWELKKLVTHEEVCTGWGWGGSVEEIPTESEWHSMILHVILSRGSKGEDDDNRTNYLSSARSAPI